MPTGSHQHCGLVLEGCLWWLITGVLGESPHLRNLEGTTTIDQLRLFSSLASLVEAEISNAAAHPLQYYLHEYQPLQLSTEGQQFVSVIGPDGFAVVITL